MSLGNPASIRVLCEPVVKVFDNSSAVLVRPEVPDWMRTSTVGVWILGQLQAAPKPADEIVADVAAHYGLPREAVEAPTLRFLDALVEHGFARGEVPDDRSRPADAKPSEHRPRRLGELPLQQLWLHVTSRCNLRCQHCYYPIEHPGRDLPVTLASELFEQATRLGVTQVVVSGGEPMLHADILGLLRACRSAGEWYVKLVTNGTMPDERTFDEAVALVDDVQVSVDGTDAPSHDAVRGPGSFARVSRAFKRLHDTEARAFRGLSFTPVPENVDHMLSLNKLGYQFAADYIHVNHPKLPADPAKRGALEARGFLDEGFVRRALANFRRLYVTMLSDRRDARGMTYRPLHLDASFNYASSLVHLLHQENCGAGVTTLGFDPSGGAYPCAALTGRESCRLGTFPDDTLQALRGHGAAWNQSVFSVDRDSVCRQCAYRHFCGGGCRAVSDDPCSRDVFCPVIRESYDEFFKYVTLPEQEELVRAGSDQPAGRKTHVRTGGCTETQ